MRKLGGSSHCRNSVGLDNGCFGCSSEWHSSSSGRAGWATGEEDLRLKVGTSAGSTPGAFGGADATLFGRGSEREAIGEALHVVGPEGLGFTDRNRGRIAMAERALLTRRAVEESGLDAWDAEDTGRAIRDEGLPKQADEADDVLVEAVR